MAMFYRAIICNRYKFTAKNTITGKQNIGFSKNTTCITEFIAVLLFENSVGKILFHRNISAVW